jgi:hypothetical protein
MISAILMTVFKQHIHFILLGFCIMQTAGLGCMATADPENINTAWAPLILGLLGVGGVLLPSQVVFSIISPPEHIGASVALSIVVRSAGQVIGVSMFYNIFKQNITKSVDTHVQEFLVPAVGLVGADPAAITSLLTALTAGPFDVYAHLFNATTQAQIDAIVKGGHEVYKGCFGELYLISTAFGGAAILCFFFLADIRKFMNDNVAVHLG